MEPLSISQTGLLILFAVMMVSVAYSIVPSLEFEKANGSKGGNGPPPVVCYMPCLCSDRACYPNGCPYGK
jgi:hypothetical protein